MTTTNPTTNPRTSRLARAAGLALACAPVAGAIVGGLAPYGAFASSVDMLQLGDGLNQSIDGDTAGSVFLSNRDFRDRLIPDNIPNARIFFTVRGGDGGDGFAGKDDECFRKGGEGATTGLQVEVGDGPGQIKPGGRLRFIAGQRGNTDFSRFANASSPGGGGGGSAVLYLPPGGPDSADGDWEILAVAGGGGGAWANISFGICGLTLEASDANTGEQGFLGGGLRQFFINGNFASADGGGGDAYETFGGGGGGGWREDGDNTWGGQKGFPAGNAGGPGTGAYLSDGGWGFGGGGSGRWGFVIGGGGGGGGGYSGGGGGGGTTGPGGGGGSFANQTYAVSAGGLLGSEILIVPSDGPDGLRSANGWIEYELSTPKNDFEANAIAFTPGDGIRGTCYGAVNERGSMLCGDSTFGDVYYTWTNDQPCAQLLDTNWPGQEGLRVSAIVGGIEQCMERTLGSPVYVPAGETVVLRVMNDTQTFFFNTSITESDADGDGICDTFDDCPGGADVDCNENGIADCVEDLSSRIVVGQSFDTGGVGHAFTTRNAVIDTGLGWASIPSQAADDGSGLATDGSLIFETPVTGEISDSWEVSFDFLMLPTNAGLSLSVLATDQSTPTTLLGAEGVTTADTPIIELELDAFRDGPGDTPRNTVELTPTTALGTGPITATPSFNMDNGTWHTAVLRYETESIGVARVSVTLLRNTVEPEVLIDDQVILSSSRLGRFIIGSTANSSTGGQREALIDNVRITDFSNNDDGDGDGIPNACDDVTPLPPPNGTCDTALPIGMGTTAIDTGSGPGWFTVTPSTDFSCVSNPELTITLVPAGENSCASLSVQQSCIGPVFERAGCDESLTYTAFGFDPLNSPILIRVDGGVAGDLIVEVTGDNDADDDGVCDDADLCQGFDDAIDSDSDGVPDGCDTCPGGDDTIDTDNDGVPDDCDICPGGDDNIDTDGDGTPDACDLCPGGDDALDFDGDGVPDDCDACPGADDFIDNNADGTPDGCEVGAVPCGVADVAQPFGTLDTADVERIIEAAARSGESPGDGTGGGITVPNEFPTVNFLDVIALLAIYDAGCEATP